jgi:hypothetical protein
MSTCSSQYGPINFKSPLLFNSSKVIKLARKISILLFRTAQKYFSIHFGTVQYWGQITSYEGTKIHNCEQAKVSRRNSKLNCSDFGAELSWGAAVVRIQAYKLKLVTVTGTSCSWFCRAPSQSQIIRAETQNQDQSRNFEVLLVIIS